MIINIKDLLSELSEKILHFSETLKNQEIARAWWKDFMVRFCWSSNSLEGNTLSLEETLDVIEYDEVRSGHTYSEYSDAKSLYHAIKKTYGETADSVSDVFITQDWIKRSNALITNTSGEYRNENVYIGILSEAIYYPPDFTRIQELMDDYIRMLDINVNSLEEFFADVAKKHILFERIHPFKDGNGRTGRMILNQQFINSDLLPIVITKTSDYRQAFRIYDRNEDTSKMEYLLIMGELNSIEKFKEFCLKADRRNDDFAW